MKRMILLLIAAFALSASYSQERSRFCFSTSLGTGFSIGQPASTPVVWRIAGYYRVGTRLLAGAGTGLSFYEKPLIPVYADARVLLTRERKFTPFLSCGIGYAFAPEKKTQGGFLLSPSVGVQYALPGGRSVFLSAGYEAQRLGRQKEYAGEYFSAAFAETLRHSTVMLTAGFLF